MLDIQLAEIQKLADHYPPTLFDHLERYVLFVGHGHSGHSLVGALLDAHPEIVIANELNIAQLVERFQLSPHQLQALILHYASKNSCPEGWLNTGYRYFVPNAWQGNYTRIRVLGDKKGGGTSRILNQNPALLDQLYECFAEKLHVISIIRNPFDNLSAMAYRRQRTIDNGLIDHYFRNASAILKVRSRLPDEQFLLLRHEDFVLDPQLYLERLFAFLGCSAPPPLLGNCIRIINPVSHARRYKTAWPAKAKKKVLERMATAEFSALFRGYRF
ncbi:sulfotransferase family protein [Nitrosococcus oceani]|uniref:sulfotransferase family protein n=1 Tax=Nitrosococcus oceani TaxID=1229 RepID=UPI0004E94746|nr:sulfotransferase [Nitrosococcus oceani]KFI23328.1 hypothetical protein HW44_03595 [Nitrosococcus oceani]